MNGLWRAIRLEARSWPSSGAFWWLMVLAPVLALGLVELLLGQGTLHNLPMALCDQDRSTLSREVGRWVDGTPSMRVTRLAADPEEGNTLLRRGEVFGFIVIPRNFERDVLRRRPAKVIAYIEGQHMATAGILSRDLSDLGIAFWREQDINTRMQTGVPAGAALSQSSTVGLDVRPIANPGINYRLFLVPGILPALLQLLATLAAVCSLDKLAARRTARRESGHAADIPAVTAVAGTLMALVLWFWLLGLGLAGALGLRGVLVLTGPPHVTALAYLLFVLACVCLGALLYGMTNNQIQSLSVVSAFSSPAFAFAGLTFPLASMPLLGRMWASLLPVTHLLKIQVACGQLGAAAATQRPAFLALALIAILPGTAGILLSAWKVDHQGTKPNLGPERRKDASQAEATSSAAPQGGTV